VVDADHKPRTTAIVHMAPVVDMLHEKASQAPVMAPHGLGGLCFSVACGSCSSLHRRTLTELALRYALVRLGQAW
jgi:hypothetical protein